ncbi:MAG: T9SS type A sorting domain-containing protein [Cytophagaceae bacterium]|nr:T9SS type A sorting domain-containing protein [Cytophagaceae bacterium]
MVYDGIAYNSFRYFRYNSAQENIRVTSTIPGRPSPLPGGVVNTFINANNGTCPGVPGVSYRVAAKNGNGNGQDKTRKDSVYAMMDSLKYQLGDYRAMKEWQGEIIHYFDDEKKQDDLQTYAESIRDCNLEACNTFTLYLMERYHGEGFCKKGHERKKYARDINPGDKEIEARARYFEYRCRQTCDTTHNHYPTFGMMSIHPQDSIDLVYLAASGTALAEIACIELGMFNPHNNACDWEKIRRDQENPDLTLKFKMPEPGPECKKNRDKFLKKGFEEETGFKADKKGAQLSQNIPNPASNETVIPYIIPVDEDTEIKEAYIIIHNMMTGVEVMQIPLIDAGYSTVGISLDRFSSGIYTYTLVVNSIKQDIKKMVIVK